MSQVANMYEIRWMLRKDLHEVCEIDDLNHAKKLSKDCWYEEDFVKALRTRNKIGLVAIDKDVDAVVGYMIYELFRDKYKIVRMAVHRRRLRSKIGTELIEKMKHKLWGNLRKKLSINVDEYDVTLQLFLKSVGFKWIRTDDGIYVMEYHK